MASVKVLYYVFTDFWNCSSHFEAPSTLWTYKASNAAISSLIVGFAWVAIPEQDASTPAAHHATMEYLSVILAASQWCILRHIGLTFPILYHYLDWKVLVHFRNVKGGFSMSSLLCCIYCTVYITVLYFTQYSTVMCWHSCTVSGTSKKKSGTSISLHSPY